MNRKHVRTILDAAESVTKEQIGKIRLLETRARMSIDLLHTFAPRMAHDIAMEDVVERLQRNSRAYAYLLSLAADVAEHMNREICAIFQAQDAHDQENADSKMDRWKDLYYAQHKKEANERYRAKQNETPEAE